jgi:hypothetical protein
LMHLKLSMPHMILVPFLPQIYDILQRLWLVKLNDQKIKNHIENEQYCYTH